jgi:hypothetical protein
MIDIINGNGDTIINIFNKLEALKGEGLPAVVTYQNKKISFHMERTQLVETQDGQTRRWETKGIEYLPHEQYFNLPTL